MKLALIFFSVSIFATGCSDSVALRTEAEESNIALVRHQLEQMDIGNLEVFDEICAPDYKYYAPGGGDPLSCAEHKESARQFYEAFSDFGHTIDVIFADDDKVGFRLSDFGTHTGEFGGIAPTGRRVEFSVTGIYRFENGKVAEAWLDADLLSLFAQLGATPQVSETSNN